MTYLMNTVDALAGPKLDEAYPRSWPARMEFDILRSHTASHLVETAYGDPGRRLSKSDQRAKFGALASASGAQLARSCEDAMVDRGAVECLLGLLEEMEDEQK